MELNSYVFPRPKQSYTFADLKGDIIWIPKIENFSYREKMKYTNFNTKVVCKSTNNLQSSINSARKRSQSIGGNIMAQKVPTVSFSFDNKFLNDKKQIEHIPCLYIHGYESKYSKLVIYFHANYEDLGLTHQSVTKLCKYLKYNILCVEYPGYGIYKSETKCSSEEIIKDADIIYKFLTNVINVSEDNIIVMGRCIGSGPAIYLASKYNPLSLILVAPIKSIKFAAKSVFGKLGLGWIAEKLIKER
jgi:hypothetical protein